MPRRRIAASLSAVAVAGLVGASALPAIARQSDPGPDDSARAVRLLHRAAVAHTNIGYRGTRLVSSVDPRGSATVVLDVQHEPGEGTALRVDGGADPDPSGVTFLAQGEIDAGDDPMLEGGPLRLLVDNYAVTVTGHDHVTGRPVAIVTASHDGVATGRFWIDRSTGLLLRREVYDAAGRLVRVSAFVALRFEPPSLSSSLPVRMPQPEPRTMSLSALSELRRRGWECPPMLPDGFRVTDVRRLSTPSPAVQTSYSDGLSTVSVFEQHGALDPDAVSGFHQRSVDGATVYIHYGLPTYLTWASDSSVYTAVTDAPATYLPDLVRAYPVRNPTQISWQERLLRGSGRLLTWVSPVAMQL